MSSRRASGRRNRWFKEPNQNTPRAADIRESKTNARLLQLYFWDGRMGGKEWLGATVPAFGWRSTTTTSTSDGCTRRDLCVLVFAAPRLRYGLPQLPCSGHKG